MRFLISILLTLFSVLSLSAQDLPAAYRAYREKYPEGPALNQEDSLFMMNIPEKKMPAYLRATTLPAVLDNSELPFLRPVFEQVGPSCGQAAMIGYNFTYEMACLRDQPALYPQTQYPTHFAYNFQNGGDGYWGVSYFHSIEILRLCGTMNSYDYGNFYDDGMRWINGYGLYYNGMYNRVKGVYSIKTGTAEGINTLKHWLYDHMGEQVYGGVASYYANTPWNANHLNDTTPEGGKFVMTAWYPVASHAMTIVGYNDSIRWDYNNDGQYTNDIDLNGDEIIDPRDWEIGGVKFVNSHGMGAQDSGFCYMMYKCLAETFENGGVWNQEVHILDIDPLYQPLLTYKVTLKHDSREKVKILAGVSADTADAAPEWLMEFPIMDYQGGTHYLQGHDTSESQKSLEFGLDVTPLLSHIQPGQPAKFFFVVDENDPKNEGEGEISAFSVMDYNGNREEIISTETPVSIINNSRTMASVIHDPDFDMVEITTESLAPFTVNVPYSQQLEADGGTTPYSWSPVYKYRLEQSTESFPGFHDVQVLDNAATDTIMPVALGFSFPYYGENYDTAWMHINGHLQFDHAQLPWPYMMEPVLLYRSNRIIAPMSSMRFTITAADGDGGWVEYTDTTVTFRWKLSWTDFPGTSEMNFATRLHENGDIEFLYGNSTLQGIPWLGGISAGNKLDFVDCPLSGASSIEQGQKIIFRYRPVPAQMDLSSTGILTGQVANENYIYDLSFRVADKSGISTVKDFELTSGPYLSFIVHAGGDDRIDYGDTVSLDLEVKNGSSLTISNAVVELSTDDFFLDISDFLCTAGTLSPGQVVTIPDAFQFTVSSEVPDQRDLLLEATLTSSEKSWHKDLVYMAYAPDVRLDHFFVDEEDGRLDPGDTAPLMITLRNFGHAPLDVVSASLVSLSTEVTINDNPIQDYGTITKGASVTMPYMLQANASTPNGFIAYLVLSWTSEQGLESQDTIALKIGKTPVLVIDMDPNHHSAPAIFDMLNDLNVISEYEYSIPSKSDMFQSMFLCLGFHNSNHILTLGEGTRLAEYLDNGGKLYMEGRKTWRDDPGTPIQPKFNISTAQTVGVYDTIYGTEGTFTQGFSLVNDAATPFSFYYMQALAPAFNILQDNNTGQVCAVAYDQGTYKTIGALFELGTLSGIPPYTTVDLLATYLEFFGIDFDPVGIGEQGGREAWGHRGVEVWPNPSSWQLTVDSWQLTVGGWRSAVGFLGSEVGGQRSEVRLEVVDLFGRKVLSFRDISSFPFTFDISDLSDGMYVVRMYSDDGFSGTAKFLKVSR